MALIVPLTRALARQVYASLCPRDREEMEAVLPEGTDLATWAEDTLPGRDAWAAIIEGDGVASLGAHVSPMSPWLAQVYCVGTRRKAEAGTALHRAAIMQHQALEARGVRRFQATCLAGPEADPGWVLRLGYEHEGEMRGYGRNGEDFNLWGRYGIE